VTDLWAEMQDRSLPPIPGLPFEDWQLPSPHDVKLTPGGWAALEACVAPGRRGLYLYQRGRVGWAVACPPFVVFSGYRCLYIGHAGRVLREVWIDNAGVVEAVQQIAAAIAADPALGAKLLTPRAEVQPEPAAGTDPAWEWTVLHLAIAYRARALDGGAWTSLAREIYQEAHRARDLIRMAEQTPEPEPPNGPEPAGNVITFAEIVRRSRRA
jgi:hypothetical protein